MKTSDRIRVIKLYVDTNLIKLFQNSSCLVAVHRQQQESNTRTTSSSNQTSSSSMSVSVPNLTSTMEQTVSLLETFAMVARRNLGNNSGSVMSAVTGSNNNPCSSLVRLALSSNSPGMLKHVDEFCHWRVIFQMCIYIETVFCPFTVEENSSISPIIQMH